MTVDEFPIEIRHLMMYRQKEQKGIKDWGQFQKFGKTGGFVFAKTPEKNDFWANVIIREQISIFYDKYPKVQYPKDMPEEIIMLALDRRVEQGWKSGGPGSFGFTWSKTPEMYDFWHYIHKGKYDVYYEKYGGKPSPAKPSLSYGGDIADFPPEIVEMMLQRQFEQTGKRDVSVFEDYRINCKDNGGFNWNESPEDNDFWKTVIHNKKFDIFFEEYPKEFFSHIKTKQNDKENTTSNTAIKVQRPVATITEGERRTASGVSGRRSSTAVASRRIGYQTVTGL